MSDVLKVLNNIRSLRVLAREISLEQLEGIVEKLELVLQEKREMVKAEQMQKAKRLEDLNKYKQLLAEDGISAEELVELLGSSTDAKKREPRAPRPAKYQYINEVGEHKTWTGQGRMPIAIQKQLASGKTLADFEI